MGNLENGGGRGDVGERRLNGAGAVLNKSGLDELALKVVGGGCRGFKLALELLGGPLGARCSAHECENSHFQSRKIGSTAKELPAGRQNRRDVVFRVFSFCSRGQKSKP